MNRIFRQLVLAGSLMPTGLPAQQNNSPPPDPTKNDPIKDATALVISNYKGHEDLMMVPSLVGACFPDGTLLSDSFSLFFEKKSLPATGDLPDPALVADFVTKAGAQAFNVSAKPGDDPEALVVTSLKSALEKASADLTQKFGFPVYYSLQSHLQVERNAPTCKVSPSPRAIPVLRA